MRRLVDGAMERLALSLGYLSQAPFEDDAVPRRKLCMTIDGYSGRRNEALGNAVCRFKELTAACVDIAGLWATIQPPPGAVLQIEPDPCRTS